jgi:hypothetical protein
VVQIISFRPQVEFDLNMMNEQIMIMARLGQLQGIARKNGQFPKDLHGILAGYKDILTNELSQKLPPRRGKKLLEK